MFTMRFKSLSLVALLILTAISSAMVNAEPLPPNMYELNGNNLHILYTTTGFDGKPRFTLQNAKRTYRFAGNQIRSVKTELGTLVSVTLSMTIDSGSTSFSILLPNVNLDNGLETPITTEGIVIKHKFSMIPSFNTGQLDNYTFYKLAGKAALVVF